jgi:hypothetical protein
MAAHFCSARPDKRLHLLPRLTECLLGRRKQNQVEHSVLEMLPERIYSLVLGYEDRNDHGQLRNDPVFALLAGREEVEQPVSWQKHAESKGAGQPEADR